MLMQPVQPRSATYQGIELVIDRPIGTVQRGVGKDGKEWERTYSVDYGYIPGTLGGDGEGLDVFVGTGAEDPEAHWAVQVKHDGTFDEYKLFLGCGDAAGAKKVYRDHIPIELMARMFSTPVELVKALRGLEPVEIMKCLHAADIVRALRPTHVELEGYEFTTKAAGPSAKEHRYVLGPVLFPNRPDAQKDIYTPEVIEEAAWTWMMRFQNTGLMHKILANDMISPVESYIVRADAGEVRINGKVYPAGTWMLGAIITDDTLWAATKAGKYNAWSIGGFAKKVPIDKARAAEAAAAKKA